MTLKFFLYCQPLTTLRTCKLVVTGTVDGNDNQEEKTREVADIEDVSLQLFFLQLGCDRTRFRLILPVQYQKHPNFKVVNER